MSFPYRVMAAPGPGWGGFPFAGAGAGGERESPNGGSQHPSRTLSAELTDGSAGAMRTRLGCRLCQRARVPQRDPTVFALPMSPMQGGGLPGFEYVAHQLNGNAINDHVLRAGVGAVAAQACQRGCRTGCPLPGHVSAYEAGEAAIPYTAKDGEFLVVRSCPDTGAFGVEGVMGGEQPGKGGCLGRFADAVFLARAVQLRPIRFCLSCSRALGEGTGEVPAGRGELV